MPRHPRGFIALTSALVIAAVLLLIATRASLSGFSTRADALYLDYKEASETLAEACVATTLLSLADDPSYLGDATTTVGSDACYTGPITMYGTPPNRQFTFRTRAYARGAYTTYMLATTEPSFKIVSETEVSTFQ